MHCMQYRASDDITLGYLSGKPSDDHCISKNRKQPTFASYHKSLMTSLRGIIKTKKVPPPMEETHNTMNISYLENLQNLFTPILP